MHTAANSDGTYSDVAGGIDAAVSRAQQDGWGSHVMSDAAELTVIDNLANTQCPKMGF